MNEAFFFVFLQICLYNKAYTIEPEIEIPLRIQLGRGSAAEPDCRIATKLQ